MEVLSFFLDTSTLTPWCTNIIDLGLKIRQYLKEDETEVIVSRKRWPRKGRRKFRILNEKICYSNSNRFCFGKKLGVVK